MTDVQLAEVESQLWSEAERLAEEVYKAQNEIAPLEADLVALETKVDVYSRSLEELASPIPQPSIHEGAFERMQLLESAFGIKIRRVSRGQMKVTLSFEPPIPQLSLVLSVYGELAVQSCVPAVIGLDSLVKEVNKSSAEGHLARFLLQVRARHRKQRAPH